MARVDVEHLEDLMRTLALAQDEIAALHCRNRDLERKLEGMEARLREANDAALSTLGDLDRLRRKLPSLRPE